MSRPVIGRGMFGLGGSATDPGEIAFSQSVAELGVNIGRSPYNYYDVNEIAADFDAAPSDAVLLLWGTSLGCNDCPVVAVRTKRIIHGMFGFQASNYGDQTQVPANVLFAHEFYNPIWIMTWGLGNHQWSKAPGNFKTSLYTTKHYAYHPGETPQAQATFLAEMRRIIAKPGD